MDRAERNSLAALPLILAVAAAITWAGSQGGMRAAGLPVFAWCAGLAFALNWLAFVPAWLRQTERYFDLMGSLTYLALVATALALRERADPRALLLAAMVTIWALRLGSFLFARIRRDGSDGRFDAIKPSAPRFAMTWTLQGLWVLLTLSCALAAMTGVQARPLGLPAALGSALWLAGLAIEALADEQKRRFRADPRNRDRFIREGLWAWSRHPNYFGEIALWTGIACVALPALSGWQHATLVSPLFVYLLLTRISGIPLLESRAKKRWGDDPEYLAHRERTPVLFPRPPRAA